MTTPTPTAPTPPFDIAALTRWLTPRLPGFAGPLTVEPLQGGQSNPTWLLRTECAAWVMRAKPAPTRDLLPSAHAIEREFAVLRALQGSAVPVPRAELLCEDESVIGVAFYVMAFVEGRIFRDASLPGLAATERAAVYAEANRVIAALHGVDWRAAGLAGFGRQEQYFERMIARWTRQYRASETQPIEAMERLIDWLPRHIPAQEGASADVALVHGDFRIDNLVFAPDETQAPRVLAVLDWELSTLGHPLSDLAYHCMAWHIEPGVLFGMAGCDLAALGLPTERDHIAQYCRRTGRDMDAVLAHWPFYLACNFFRLAAILQGIARRALDGTANSPRALEAARMAAPMAERGWQIAQSQPRHLATA